jgi:hypothetical protein
VSSTSHHLRVGRLLARALAVAGLLLAMGAAGLAEADTSTAAACPSSSGVTVVVDYGSLGGTSVGCATTLGSGLDVLKAAGHTVTFVSPRQQGFVCTIDRLPDPCNGAPSTAYWSYWHASAGGTWSYSSVGAASTHPKSGTVEGWAFGAGKPPAMRPPSRPRPATSSTTSSSRTSASRPASTGAAGSSGGTTTTATTRATTAPTKTTTTTTASATTAASPSDDATTDALAATRTDAAAPTSATSSSGGTGTLVVAALLVLLLAGGGGVLAWRRHGRGA